MLSQVRFYQILDSISLLGISGDTKNALFLEAFTLSPTVFSLKKWHIKHRCACFTKIS